VARTIRSNNNLKTEKNTELHEELKENGINLAQIISKEQIIKSRGHFIMK
jgi:hypothetical protein